MYLAIMLLRICMCINKHTYICMYVFLNDKTLKEVCGGAHCQLGKPITPNFPVATLRNQKGEANVS